MTNKYSGLGIVKSVKKSGFGCPQVHIINIGTTTRTFFFLSEKHHTLSWR